MPRRKKFGTKEEIFGEQTPEAIEKRRQENEKRLREIASRMDPNALKRILGR